MVQIALEPVERVRVTILMDNVTEFSAPSIVPARRLCADHRRGRSSDGVRDGFSRTRHTPGPRLGTRSVDPRRPSNRASPGGARPGHPERCGHAGIVNMVRYAQKLTGETDIAAIIVSFHLSGPAFEPIIAPTVRAFDELSPALLCPERRDRVVLTDRGRVVQSDPSECDHSCLRKR